MIATQHQQQRISVVVFAVIILLVILLLMKKPRPTVIIAQQSTAVDLYAYAQRLTIRGVTDPPCTRTQNVYVCAGYCPWTHTHSNELVSCSFLPRIPHPDFVKYGIYCTPEPDYCPTYNAWLKDSLPPTRQFIRRIPQELLSNFTLNHSISVDYGIQDFREHTTLSAEWTVELIEKFRQQLRQRIRYSTYSNNDIYLALDKYASLAVNGKNCAVIGSENPWIEAALLEYNASMVTTIEYASIKSSVPRLRTITPMEFARKQQKEAHRRDFFDSVWSYSSLEHDGLGRYQDPLNAYGDLQTMTKITCLLKPGGLLFLGMPINIEDSLAFNLHRINGPIRLPLLYRYFHIVELLGLGMARNQGDWAVQHFVVLQNKVGCRNS